jgi:RNA polymerase sigma-70 factor (ECF subfamily)
MSKFADIQIDPAIVRRAARGDAKAHEILYRAFSAPVYSICLRFTRVPAQAEDLTQETFMEVIRSITQFRGDAPVGIWIRRIAVSKALMFLRSAWHARGQSLDEDWEQMTFESRTAAAAAKRQDQAMDLDAALGSLPAVSRAVVWLHDVEGYTHKEIAGLMGKTESFSKSQLSRAYQRLRPMLDAELERTDSKSAMQRSVLRGWN